MNKKMRMFIICAVFALISSCKYYASSEDLKNQEQNVKGKVKGFLDTKERIVSDDPTVYEIAEKLKEEEELEEEELKDKEEKEDFNKNDLKDNEDAKVLKPEPKPIPLENKEPKVEIAEKILKPELPEIPNLPVVVKPVVKEKTEEETAKDREAEELKRRRIEKYKKEEEERLERKKQREERKKLRELEANENFLEKITKSVILAVTKKIDKITGDIDSINQQSSFEEIMEVSGKEVEDKVTGAIYDDITNSYSSGNSIYSEWSDYLEEESGFENLIDELEKARTELRGKIKEGNDNNEKNKNTVKISDIKEDLAKLKDSLRKLKEYLQSSANKEEIQKAVKCSMDPSNDDCE
ncbi:hypothetical protein [Borreliella bavariensis]|uniref:hypothetical protein n=1 Tax=Borreliella bavariensis TaxID=664662 RepID=UPI001BFFF236|nr:hypothetical protein [Borreliella bavariensis]